MAECQDKPKESKDKSSESKGNKVDKASIKESKEAQAGMPKLVQDRQALIKSLKDGASSGVSKDFGKPSFVGAEAAKPAKDAKPAGSAKDKAAYSSKPKAADSTKTKSADSGKDDGNEKPKDASAKAEQEHDKAPKDGDKSAAQLKDMTKAAAKDFEENQKPGKENQDENNDSSAKKSDEREAEQERSNKNSEKIGGANTDLQAISKAENEVGRKTGSVDEKTSGSKKDDSEKAEEASKSKEAAKGGEFEKGMQVLSQDRKNLVEFLKKGGSSGISVDFGKPQIIDDSKVGVEANSTAIAADFTSATTAFTSPNQDRLLEQTAPADVKATTNLTMLNKNETLMDRLSQHAEAEYIELSDKSSEETKVQAPADNQSNNQHNYGKETEAPGYAESAVTANPEHGMAAHPEQAMEARSDSTIKPEHHLTHEQSKELTQAIKQAAEAYLLSQHDGILPPETLGMLNDGIKRAVGELSGTVHGDATSSPESAKGHDALERAKEKESRKADRQNKHDKYDENKAPRFFKGVENSSPVDGTPSSKRTNPGDETPLYRGANPGGSNDQHNPWSAERLVENLQDMKAHGIKVVVDFEDPNDTDPMIAMRITAEQDACAALGIKFVAISMNHDGPGTEQKAQFLKTIQEADGGVYCHCREGRDRTGFMVAYAQEHIYGISSGESNKQDGANGYNPYKANLYGGKLDVPSNQVIPAETPPRTGDPQDRVIQNYSTSEIDVRSVQNLNLLTYAEALKENPDPVVREELKHQATLLDQLTGGAPNTGNRDSANANNRTESTIQNQNFANSSEGIPGSGNTDSDPPLQDDSKEMLQSDRDQQKKLKRNVGASVYSNANAGQQ